MTNRKIKNYHKNMVVYAMVEANFKMVALMAVVLHKNYPKQFYHKRIDEWFADLADTCKQANEFDRDDAYDWKMERWVERFGIDPGKCMKLITKHFPTYHPQNQRVLTENVKLGLVQCADFGFGKERISRLQDLLLEYEDDLHIIVDEHGEYNPIDPHTLGQFTGFTDQQSEKIFEGDILLHEHELYTMGFIEKYGRYAPTKPKCVFAWFDISNSIIAGNVHDDKGLVGGEE